MCVLGVLCRVVCCACVLKWLCVYNEWCVGCAFCVLCVVLCCCCVVLLCCLCVARIGTRKTPVCRFKNPSVCTGKTRACVQHARVLPLHTEAFRTCTRRRFEPTHGRPLSLPLFLSSLLLSLFRRSSFSLSFVLFLCSLLSCLLSLPSQQQ